VVVALNVTSWSLGGFACRWLGGLPGGLASLARLGVGLIVLSYGVLALAACHLLRAPFLAALVVVPGLVLLLALLRSPPRSIRALTPGRAGWAAAFGGALLLLDPFLQVFGLDYGWDALTYHLALPERYLFYNGIHVTPLSTYTTFPLNVEMLYLAALGIAGPTAAKLIHLEFGVLTLLAVAVLGRRISPRAAWLVPLILLSDPLFVWETTIAYNDLALCFYFVLALAFAQEWIENGARSRLVLAGVFAGGCFAIRYPGGAVAMALALVAAAAARGRQRLAAPLVLGGTAFLVGTPWLVRNAAFTGNPVSPTLQSLFHAPGREYYDPLAVRQLLSFTHGLGMGHGWADLALLPWNLVMRSQPGVYTNSFGFQVSGLYLVSLALCVIAGHWPARVRRWMAVAGLLAVVWFYTAQEARYLLPALCTVALAGAFALDRLARPGLRSAPWVAVVLSAVVSCHWQYWNRLGHDWAVAFGRLDRTNPARYDPAELLASHLRALLRQSGAPHRILLLFESRAWFFRGLEYLPYQGHETPVVMLHVVHRARDERDLLARLQAMGVTHVVANPSALAVFHPLTAEGYTAEDVQRDLQLAVRLLDRCTRPLFAVDTVAAYEMPPDGQCRDGP
jgi:hypothetical protein